MRILLVVLTAASARGFGSLFKGLFNRSALDCRDEVESCAAWAADDECETNPGFMHASCAKSCGQCEVRRRRQQEEQKESSRTKVGAAARWRGSLFSGGCNDDAEYDCERRARGSECDSNKGEMLLRCPSSCRVCAWQKVLQEALGCEDQSDRCAEWARHGECNANPTYMHESCSVSCDVCESKRSSCDRPANTPPLVRAGGINETMMRILRDFPEYRPTALSRPGVGRLGAKAPWVMSLENFLSAEEADAFTSTCDHHFQRSLAGDQLSPVRTSEQCWCSSNECERHELTQRVARRISNLTGAPIRYMEPFQVLKYEPGQFYRQHHDQNSGLFTPQGARVYTFFMYLSTPTRGGGTKFNNLDIVVPAVRGNAVMWPSVTSDDPNRDEPYTNHEAMTLEEGRKFASNVWIHQYDYRTPAGKNCLLTHKNTH